MSRFFMNVAEVFGIVLFRFRPLPRIWGVWLVAANAACLYYLAHVEAQVVLAATATAVALQAAIYGRIGFTRILGVTHLIWIPMFAWMATRLDVLRTDPALAAWLAVLLATNLVSLVVDLADAARFLRGERAPHYRWRPAAAAE